MINHAQLNCLFRNLKIIIFQLENSNVPMKPEKYQLGNTLGAMKGDNDCIHEISQGVDVNVRDSYGITLLMWAAANGDYDRLRLLLDAGASVNIISENGTSALLEAAMYGHLSCVTLLTQSGASGKYALDTAAKDGHLTCLKTLIQADGNVNNYDDTDGVTPLMHASSWGKHEYMKLLVKRRS